MSKIAFEHRNNTLTATETVISTFYQHLKGFSTTWNLATPLLNQGNKPK